MSVDGLFDTEDNSAEANITPKNPLKLGERKKLSCSIDRLTMKLLFALLISTAWTFTGAQYYYQGLMDYLENRLLAIEVRIDSPLSDLCFKWQLRSLCSHKNIINNSSLPPPLLLI